jgi:vitamin B12 transporter
MATALVVATNSYASSTTDDLGVLTVSSATKSTQSIQDVTSNVEVITNVELEEKHAQTIGEALNSLSGVTINSNGGLGQRDSLFIRGVKTKRILILVDGIRYNEPTGLSGAPLAQLMIDDVERIEVVKGPQSGIWGADASGGVVNIITKKAKDGVHGSFLAETGSFNTKKYSANVSAKEDRVSFKINANKITTDGYSAYEPKQGNINYGKRGKDLGLEKDGYENLTYTLQSALKLTDNDEIDVLYKNIDAEYDYDSTSGDNLTNKSYINHYFRAINYNHTLDKYSLKLTAKQSKFNRNQNTFYAKSKINEFSLLNKVDYNKKDTFIFGLNKQNFEDSENNQKYQTNALFISNLNKFEKLVLSENIRYDNNNKFEEKITGKLGAKYNFQKELYLSANYGTAYNAPSLGNLGYTASLKPETTKAYDISAYYKKFKVTYFHNEITDMIQYISGSYPNTAYENLSGKSILKGYEFEYRTTILDEIFLSLNYTRLSAKNSQGEKLARRADETLKASLDYYGFDKLHLGINAQYIGTRYDDDNQQGAQTGRYTVASVVANYDIRKNLKIYTKVDNITDKYYQTSDGYATSPRAYYAGVKVSF